ncbi:MAG TPA: DUF72 domain-containing protein [Clostridia bacterium]|nr:DUF72 domain-containing protein [Clostridia bacterium]
MMGEIWIGTSGWHYKHWLGNFYPEKMAGSKMLEFYMQHFDTVELNNSFYKLPKTDTFVCWRDATPSKFLFAVKASRFITHNKKLKDPQNALGNFLPRAEVLGPKLGPILFQLPPRWKLNLERLEEFLSELPSYHRYSFEFREPSWNEQRVYELLQKSNAAYCIYELAGFHTPMHITADWAYVRLHGPGGKYQGSYEHAKLREWADRIVNWSRKMRAVFVYFDNDQAGYAAQNALELKRLVGQATVQRGREEAA